MTLRSIAAALLLAASAAAQANVVVSTVGPVTIYTESFDGGSSFTGGTWVDAPSSTDDYLLLDDQSQLAIYSFDAPQALSSLQISFWYSVSGEYHGGFAVVNQLIQVLPASPGDAAAYVLNNPGPGDSAADAYFTATLTQLASGSYILGFGAINGPGSSLKVDDIVITATPIPEPGTYALVAAGLGVMGLLARRRTR